MMTADEAWYNCLRDVVLYGNEVSPRGKRTKEVLGSALVVDMTQSVVTLANRKLGYRFMAAEAAWITAGDDLVATIAPYSKIVANFSDDRVRFFGAYGPKFRSQLDYVVAALRRDPNTRQAVFNIWRENPPEVKDYPCTLNCTFLIRDSKLHAFVNMRSNDVWLGTPYDIFSASMWSAYVLLKLDDPDLGLGNLYHVAASRHLYEDNWATAVSCLGEQHAG